MVLLIVAVLLLKYRSVKISNIIEKPSFEDAPSNLSVVGRYVFSATILDSLEKRQLVSVMKSN